MLVLCTRSEAFARFAINLPGARRWLRVPLDHLSVFRDDDVIDWIYRQIGLGSGVTKQTHRGRFDAVDATTVRWINELNLRDVHDVGVSSGITSLDLWERLRAEHPGSSLTISDKYAQFHRSLDSVVHRIYESDGDLLCSYVGPLYGDGHVTWKFPLSALLHRWARKQPRGRTEPFLLYHPRVIELLDQGAIRHTQFDVLAADSPADAYDYVRCMNLLNLSYFSEDDIRRGVRALWNTLNPGGVLQIGRTDQTLRNDVSFYRKSAAGLEIIEQIGSGSEIDSIVRDSVADLLITHAPEGCREASRSKL